MYHYVHLWIKIVPKNHVLEGIFGFYFCFYLHVLDEYTMNKVSVQNLKSTSYSFVDFNYSYSYKKKKKKMVKENGI